MAECFECGEKSMSFQCHYCGNKFCSEHRLPEKHDCNGLESGKKDEWFEKKFSQKKEKEAQNKSSRKKSERSTPYKTHRKSLIGDITQSLKGNFTLMIIGATVLSYLLQITIPGYFEFLVLDTTISELLLRPWSLLTVALLHSFNPIHIAANMITFYFFGTPIERLIGGKELLKIYVISALISSLAIVGFNNLVTLIHGSAGTVSLVAGASGAVVAMVGIISMLYPDADVLVFLVIPMKIKTLVYAFGAFETFNVLLKLSGLQGSIPILEGYLSIVASSAHLAGLMVGLWYGKKLREKYKRNSGVFNPLGV